MLCGNLGNNALSVQVSAHHHSCHLFRPNGLCLIFGFIFDVLELGPFHFVVNIFKEVF